MAEILETIDWSPLFISLKTAIIATVLAFFAGIAAARFIMKLNNTAKAVVDGFIDTSTGTSAYGSRLLSVTDFQSAKTIWKVFIHTV